MIMCSKAAVGSTASLSTAQLRIHWFLRQTKVKMALKGRGLTNPGKISLPEITETQSGRLSKLLTSRSWKLPEWNNSIYVLEKYFFFNCYYWPEPGHELSLTLGPSILWRHWIHTGIGEKMLKNSWNAKKTSDWRGLEASYTKYGTSGKIMVFSPL